MKLHEGCGGRIVNYPAPYAAPGRYCTDCGERVEETTTRRPRARSISTYLHVALADGDKTYCGCEAATVDVVDVVEVSSATCDTCHSLALAEQVRLTNEIIGEIIAEEKADGRLFEKVTSDEIGS